MSSNHQFLCIGLLRTRPGLIALLFAFVVGCTEPDEVRVYSIPKEARPARTLPPNDAVHSRAGIASGSATSDAQDSRMLAALVREGDRTWSFKLTGPEEAVGEQAEDFRAFLKTVRFQKEGTPTWTLPKRWKQLPGGGMRYATLQIMSPDKPTEKPLGVSVMSLPHQQQTESQFALANVNRWRGQLGMAPIAKLDAKDSGVEPQQVDGKTIFSFDQVGKMRGGMTRGPMVGGPMPGSSKPGSSKPGSPMPGSLKSEATPRGPATGRPASQPSLPK